MFVGDIENSGNVVRPNGKKREVENANWRHVNLKYVYLSLYTRAMKFQRQYPKFGVQPSNRISVNVVRRNREKPDVADITGSTTFIYHLLRSRRVSTLVLPCWRTSKMWVLTLEFRLLSYIVADIMRYFISTYGDDSHLWLTIYPDVGKFPH